MRASILAWSTVSGVVLGVFVDALLIGVALLMGALVPGIAARLHQRWATVAGVVVLTAVPAAMALLGFLEGRLKAN